MLDFLLSAVRSADQSVYHFLNGYAGHRILDVLAAFEEENSLLKGGLFLAAYTFLWFRSGPDRENRRRAIITIFGGTLLAVVASRIIADIIPFRVRPMYEPSLYHHPHSFPIAGNMERWSSFPSDTAAYFAAMAFGVAYLVRRYSLLLALYTATWICLPRMFLGEHYLSDIVAGSAVGITSVWLCVRSKGLRLSVAPVVLSFLDKNPGLFYAAGFLAFFEMGVMFADLRSAAHLLLHVSFHLLPVACGLLAVVAGVAYAVARASGRSSRLSATANGSRLARIPG